MLIYEIISINDIKFIIKIHFSLHELSSLYEMHEILCSFVHFLSWQQKICAFQHKIFPFVKRISYTT